MPPHRTALPKTADRRPGAGPGGPVPAGCNGRTCRRAASAGRWPAAGTPAPAGRRSPYAGNSRARPQEDPPRSQDRPRSHTARPWMCRSLQRLQVDACRHTARPCRVPAGAAGAEDGPAGTAAPRPHRAAVAVRQGRPQAGPLKSPPRRGGQGPGGGEMGQDTGRRPARNAAQRSAAERPSCHRPARSAGEPPAGGRRAGGQGANSKDTGRRPARQSTRRRR